MLAEESEKAGTRFGESWPASIVCVGLIRLLPSTAREPPGLAAPGVKVNDSRPARKIRHDPPRAERRSTLASKSWSELLVRAFIEAWLKSFESSLLCILTTRSLRNQGELRFRFRVCPVGSVMAFLLGGRITYFTRIVGFPGHLGMDAEGPLCIRAERSDGRLKTVDA